MVPMLRWIVVLLPFALLSARAQLTVVSNKYGHRPGYIDHAALVVEPHGGYVEHSLYLTYSDHNIFDRDPNVEIVHRFNLPAGAIVNDLWLWMGDSVMQAIVLDTWHARKIYDSITVSLRDPAFLSRRGDQYELRIFPLQSGATRKVKLNYIVPTRWYGMQAVSELPLPMLMQSFARTKPLDLLFREREPIWGDPILGSLPDVVFTPLVDTNGYQFRHVRLDDITPISDPTLRYDIRFSEGTRFTATRRAGEDLAFQFGFDPVMLAGREADTTGRTFLLACDLSGWNSGNLEVLIKQSREAAHAATRPHDSLQVVYGVRGEIGTLADRIRIAHPDTIDALFDTLVARAARLAPVRERKPFIKIADSLAFECWAFPDMEKLAEVKRYNELIEAVYDQHHEDVLITYAHGAEHKERTTHFRAPILAHLDSLYERGGRVLSFFDYFRLTGIGKPGEEVIALSQVPSIDMETSPERMSLLQRVPTGRFSRHFRDDLVHNLRMYMRWDPDPDIREELLDDMGNPMVFSKSVKNGLLVVSTLWSFRIDGALKREISIPMLGLAVPTSGNQLLMPLFHRVLAMHAATPFDRVIFISNSDTLIEKDDADLWVNLYATAFGPNLPAFTTVNLVDGAFHIPPVVTDNQIDYYSTGYLFKRLADRSRGRHFESHIYPWSSIRTLLNPTNLPLADSLTITAVADGGRGFVQEIREVDPIPEDPNKARFFIGSAIAADSITFTVRGLYEYGTVERTFIHTVPVRTDTHAADAIIPAMLGNEHLRDMFAQLPRDTAGIVETAVRHRLLCDYTAFLALEPHDTITYMRNPFDEAGLVDAPLPATPGDLDSLVITAGPNPFSGTTTIAVDLPSAAEVTVRVTDMIGRLVRTLGDGGEGRGRRHYLWNGLDASGHPVPAGAYIVQVLARERAGEQLRRATCTLLRVQ